MFENNYLFPSPAEKEKESPEDYKAMSPLDTKKLCRFYFLIAVFILLVLILSLCIAYYVSNQDGILSKTILRAELDNRNYKAIVLINDLKALLISDPESEFCGVAMNINVGSFSDPKELQGLSHLVEHMLYKGSKKFPKSNEFFRFLEENNGERNEITGSEGTLFYFTVESDKLLNALEIFSTYFLDPLFNKEDFLYEIEQIDAEYQEIISKNEYKPHFLLKLMSSSQHPFSRFNIGNREFLKTLPESKEINNYLEMINFHQLHYSANLMNLVIIGKHSIEVLEEWAKNKFSLIKNNLVENTNLHRYPRPYGYNQLGFIAKIQGNTNDVKLLFVFPLEEMQTKFKEKPLDFIDFLICNPQQGALQSQLKRKNWIFSMKSLVFEDTNDFTLYGVEFLLTAEGYGNVSKIADFFFSYIKEIQMKGINATNYEDLSKISKISFRFSEKKHLNEEIRELAKNLAVFPIKNVITGNSIFFNYNEGMIQKTLQDMSPRNCIIMVESKNYSYFNDTKKNNANISLLEKKESVFYKEVKKTKSMFRFKQDSKEKLLLRLREFVGEEYFYKKELSGYSSLYNLSFAFEKMSTKLFQRFLNPDSRKFSFPEKNLFIPEEFTIIPTCQISSFLPFLPKINDTNRVDNNNNNNNQSETNNINNTIVNYSNKSDGKININNDGNNNSKNSTNDNNYNNNSNSNNNNNNNSNNNSKYLELRTSFLENITLDNNATSHNITTKALNDSKSNSNNNQLNNNNNINSLSKCSLNDISTDISQDYPDLLITSQSLILWHKLDRSFRVPKVEIYLTWENPVVFLSAKEYEMTNLLIQFYSEMLTEEFPEIKINGYELTFTLSSKGILMKLSNCFSHKLEMLLNKLFSILTQNPLDESLFPNVIERTKREYSLQIEEISIFQKAKAFLQKILRKKFYNNEKLLSVLGEITFQELQSFANNYKKNGRITAFFLGNILNTTAIDIMSKFTKGLNLTGIRNQDEFESEKILNVSRKSLYFFVQNEEDKQNSVLNYYQYGVKNIENLTKLFLIVNGLDAYSTNFFRINSILQDDIDISLFYESGIYGISIYLSLFNKTTVEIDSLIESFLFYYEEVLTKHTEEEFEKLKKLIISVINENDLSLEEKSQRYWNEIFSGFLNFDQKNQMRKFLETLRLEQTVSFYKYFLKEISGKISLHFSNKNLTATLLANQTYIGLGGEIYDIDKLSNIESFEITNK